MTLPESPVAVSAPGKVLLAGGYLVLDRDYTGLVFALDARIHVHISPIRTSEGVVLSEIVVRSPQFVDAIWEYGYRLGHGQAGVLVTELRADADIKLQKNVFIQTALSLTLSYISAYSPALIPPANVTILADNDYYSTYGTTVSADERFHGFGVTLACANKTGLGSSAALVTAFTGALLQYYLPRETFDINNEQSQRRLHNLAQAAHCAAQGKIGSGFDVASAVYGSCVYRRFSPAILASCGEAGSKGFAQRLLNLVNEDGDSPQWDTEIKEKAVKIPAGLRLLMCDIKGGSQTPGMVKQVLAWRKANADYAEQLWQGLQQANVALADELNNLSATSSRDYAGLKARLEKIRDLIGDLSKASGVPIEPPEQKKLIDSCGQVAGVIGGLVPGAGGYDAIALLVEDRQTVLDELRTLFDDLRADAAVGMPLTVSLLRVREEMDGVMLEDVASYNRWT